MATVSGVTTVHFEGGHVCHRPPVCHLPRRSHAHVGRGGGGREGRLDGGVRSWWVGGGGELNGGVRG